jgi:hypothetical protein
MPSSPVVVNTTTSCNGPNSTRVPPRSHCAAQGAGCRPWMGAPTGSYHKQLPASCFMPRGLRRPTKRTQCDHPICHGRARLCSTHTQVHPAVLRQATLPTQRHPTTRHVSTDSHPYTANNTNPKAQLGGYSHELGWHGHPRGCLAAPSKHKATLLELVVDGQ